MNTHWQVGWVCLWIGASTISIQGDEPRSVARFWDEATLESIRTDRPFPPVQARNLFSVSAAMYDAWAAYDPNAAGFVYHGKHSHPQPDVAQQEAINYAAYRILRERFALSIAAAATLARLEARMRSLGLDPENQTRDPSTPAGVGNLVFDSVSTWFLNDGALQSRGYVDLPASDGGYSPQNPVLNTQLSGVHSSNINRWQPLEIANARDQNGKPIGPIQVFQGSQWLQVRPFSLNRSDSTKAWFDPGLPPQLAEGTSEAFQTNVVAVIHASSQLSPESGLPIDVSPNGIGNNTLGSNDGSGHRMNPASRIPYVPVVVNSGDFYRVIAEFWADGPNSETPPGHWNVIANAVSDSPQHTNRIGGNGPVVSNLEWDVKLYFALNAGLHDAACAAWSLKRQYDGWRPISAIRFMGQLGQSTDASQPSYHPLGLPLVPDLIELVSVESSQFLGRHEGLTPGKIAIHAWAGPPDRPLTEHAGVAWIHAEKWLPFQKSNFVTPAFPGYVSGHSTFSRAAAEVLAAITGSSFFPGGMYEIIIPPNQMTIEHGPSTEVRLQWATFFDAADQAGQSRIWGGIHPLVDDFEGRRIGSKVGTAAWNLAARYFDGTILLQPPVASLIKESQDQVVLAVETIRGFTYRIRSTPKLDSLENQSINLKFLATDTKHRFPRTGIEGTEFLQVLKLTTP